MARQQSDALAATLADGALHVWTLHLRPAPPAESSAAQEFCSCLSAAEVADASGYSAPEDRHRARMARAGLRHLLGRYLGVDGTDLTFGIGEVGKPFLKPGAGEYGLEFNTSHSGDWVLYAVSARAAVGIDVEQVQPRAQMERIVNRFFAPAERTAFYRLPEERRLSAFFRVWSCKEAVIKMTGEGLSRALGSFAVSVEGPGELLHLDADRSPVATLHVLDIAPGYSAAVCAASAHAAVVVRAFEVLKGG